MHSSQTLRRPDVSNLKSFDTSGKTAASRYRRKVRRAGAASGIAHEEILAAVGKTFRPSAASRKIAGYSTQHEDFGFSTDFAA
ncbi:MULTISPECIES: hypothetical protein [unclassified Bradyrhizobium]|uniref:hypothetical protein n=1 Tax=unclassified Bradyrhizobium TaxID=2631580 RepID=UPI0024787CFA|nr:MULTISPECIES: hypothetical protein [unclassified Bradyrhizobium]WGR67923.1 hypothetical protein MTX24_20900 [Bradyrhizobium sp. ISRA426]WGR79976.1 hypothetical protein MTX21_06015 [Bradyrhizobium sp. ISRA430]WGR83162.1 hypothetical protein MTX25_20580 [Bradyrhizobium sp. ISRA432]